MIGLNFLYNVNNRENVMINRGKSGLYYGIAPIFAEQCLLYLRNSGFSDMVDSRAEKIMVKMDIPILDEGVRTQLRELLAGAFGADMAGNLQCREGDIRRQEP